MVMGLLTSKGLDSKCVFLLETAFAEVMKLTEAMWVGPTLVMTILRRDEGKNTYSKE